MNRKYSFAVWVSTILASVLFAITGQAQESFYVVNQKPGQSTLTLDYTMANANFTGGQTQAQSLGVEYRRSFSKESSFWIQNRLSGRTSTTSESASASGFGLSDFDLGVKTGDIYDLFTVIYGLSATISPGAAQDSRLGQIERTNSFSGTSSLASFAGLETYSDSVAVGVQMELRTYSDIRAMDSEQVRTFTNENRFVPRVSGFAEIPVTREFDLGVRAALARPDFAVEKYILGGAGNQYEAGLYGNLKFDQETTGLLLLSVKNQKFPLSEDRFDVAVGLRRRL